MSTDSLGRNALIDAVIVGDGEKVGARLRENTDVNHSDRSGWTALHFSAQNNDRVIAQMLIDAGACIDLRDLHGNTALFRAVFAYRNGDECISILLEAGADPDILNEHGVSPRSLAGTMANYDARKFFVPR
ncbi:ankyrin repeat domain-containing protein [Asticcacaulis sp.]|uniref:ankyrin repeat domain-containing protein n=1 Tax=Asticcacaulis sp. TaxID=1872648 RepID=UPI002615ED82|nr:ankyrin repeat domain-containing protein [Asticcacaulis sp.]